MLQIDFKIHFFETSELLNWERESMETHSDSLADQRETRINLH